MMSAWMAFCGETTCSSQGGHSCGLVAIFYASSCSNHLLVISVDVLLCVALLLKLVCRVSARRVQLQPLFRLSSPFQTCSLAVNGCLGLVYVGLVLWMVEEKLRKGTGFLPLHWWLVQLTQGFTSILIVVVASIRTGQLGEVFVRICAGFASAFAGFLCVSSVHDIVVEKHASIKLFLDILSLPGALLFLLCALNKSKDGEDHRDSANISACRPLISESDATDSDNDSVTPFANAGFLSKMSFWWLNPLMKKGSEKPLEERDIPRLSEADRAANCYSLYLKQLNKQKRDKPTSPSILWALLSCHQNEILISGFFALLKVLTLSSGPMLLRAFIKVASGEESFRYEGYALATALFLAKCLESISGRQWYFRTRRLGLQLRSQLSAAIYQKQLRLSNSARLVHSSGEIMNYVTVDAYRIGEFPFWFHQTWSTVVQLCVALVILCNAVGLATVSALAVIILTVACNAPLAKLQHKFQSGLMGAQDERLKAVTEALVNMKVLKLYAWETHFKKATEGLRKKELKWLLAFQLRRAYNIVLFWSSPPLVSAATFLTCYLLGIPLNASNAFTFIAAVRLVQYPIMQIPDVIGVVIQAKVAFARIVKYLDAPELQHGQGRRRYSAKLQKPIVIKSSSFSWDGNISKPTLKNINLDVKAGEKVAICGEVGSGKSSLVAAILGEIPRIEGLLYLCQNKGLLYGSIATLCHAIFLVGQISQNSWMAVNVQNPEVSMLRLVTVYTAIGLSTIIPLFIRCMLVVIMGHQSSKSFFSQLLNSLFRAPMSFFDSTPLGRILSRVSSDLSIVDLDIPFQLMFTINSTMNAISNLGVLAAVTWQVLFVAIPLVYLTLQL